MAIAIALLKFDDLGCSLVETLPVNEELKINFSELFMQHFTRETCTSIKSFQQTRISNYYFYTQHIRAAMNFLNLALAIERCRQSTRSSPESLFVISFQKTDPDKPPFLFKREGGLSA